MKVTKSEQIILCDVDDTLVLHDVKAYPKIKTISVEDPYCGTIRRLIPHLPHVRLLKERHKRGAVIKVMSAGGWQWAEAVVLALGLEAYVDECLSKPVAIIDDLPIEGALGATMYLNPNSKWKR